MGSIWKWYNNAFFRWRKKIIYQLIEKAKKDYFANDVDITAILDAENFTDIKIDLFDKPEESRFTLASETPAAQEKEEVEKWIVLPLDDNNLSWWNSFFYPSIYVFRVWGFLGLNAL